MSESVFDSVRRKWQETKLSLVKAFVKWSVQKLDKVSVGSFLALSWGIDDVTEYHVIVERSYSDHHIYGTKVTYYDEPAERSEASLCDNCDARSDAGCSSCKRTERSEE